MTSIKKILILLTALFLGGIIFFTSVGLKSVSHHVKIYMSDHLTTDSPNGIRVVCLGALSRYAFSSCNIDLKLVNQRGKSYQLIKKDQKNGFLNENISLPKDIKTGRYTLKGHFLKNGMLIGKGVYPIQIDQNISISNWFPFIKPEGLSQKQNLFREASIHPERKNYYQNFSRRGIIAPFSDNRIYLLATRPNYFPLSFRGRLNIRGINPKQEFQDILFDQSGIGVLDTYVQRVSGDLVLTDPNRKKHLIPFQGRFPKMEIQLKKYRFDSGETINFELKKYKKPLTTIQLSIFAGDHWVDNRMVRFNGSQNLKLSYTPPVGFNGFLDIIIHRDYDMGNYIHKRRIFVGSKTLLDLFFDEIQHPYIEQILYHRRQTDHFYEMILSQLASPFIKPPLIYDSLDDQKEILINYQKRMQRISWWFLFILSWIIVALLFFWSYIEYDRSKYAIDYDFRKKGAWVIFIVPFTIAAFLMMLLFILNIT